MIHRKRSSDLNLALNMNVPPTMLNPGIIWGYRILSGPLLKYNVKLLNACNPEQSANMSLSVVLAIQIMNTTLISVPCVVGGQSPKLYRSTPGVVPHLTLQWIVF